MGETAWKWGPYRKGMGKEVHELRMRYATRAIKKELVFLGYTGINLDHDIFGTGVKKAVQKFQASVGLTADGLVGMKTANALWKPRILGLQTQYTIPKNWLRAQVHWESADDPAATNVNTDGSVDRGLIQANSAHKPLSEDEAYDPSVSLEFLAKYLDAKAKTFDGCTIGAPGRSALAVASWRTPTGANDWCELGPVEPNKDGTWAEKAAYYLDRVNTFGRDNWVG